MALGARPIQDRIFVEVEQPDSNITTGGIVIIENNPKQKRTGRVLASGPGHINEKGKFIPNTLQVGDRVVFGSYAGVDVTVNGKEIRIMREGDVAGVVPDDVEVEGEVMARRRDSRHSYYQ
jgi:chaperonin GroES